MSMQDKIIDQRPLLRRRALVTLFMVLAGCIMLFAAAYLSHLKWDVTEEKIHTLSDSTRSILKSLDEPIMIRAYITADMPQPYGQLKRFLEDVLRSYFDAGDGHVGYEVIDPSSDPNIAASLNALQIPKVQVQVVEDDRAQVKQGYLAVVVEYLDSKEVIPIVQSEEGFEYQLTGKIKRLTGKGKKTIGVVSGFGARPLESFTQLQQAIADDYSMVSLQPDQRAIPTDLSALIVPGFTEKPSDAMRYALDQFRLSGRGMLVLTGNVEPDLAEGFQVRPIAPEAHEWLKGFGVAVEPGLVMDMRASRIGVNQRQGSMIFRTMVDYPFMPLVTEMGATHPVSGGVESVALPFVSPLVLLDGVDGSILLRSSNHAAVQSGPPYDVNPLRELSARFSDVQQRQSTLAVAVDGAAKSMFEQMPESAVTEVVHVQSTDDTRLMVIGTPALLDNTFMDAGNLLFVLNSLDWLVRDEALISLRSRGITQRPLMELSSTARAAWKGIWIFGLPLLLLCIGLWRWRQLRNVSVAT